MCDATAAESPTGKRCGPNARSGSFACSRPTIRGGTVELGTADDGTKICAVDLHLQWATELGGRLLCDVAFAASAGAAAACLKYRTARAAMRIAHITCRFAHCHSERWDGVL